MDGHLPQCSPFFDSGSLARFTKEHQIHNRFVRAELSTGPEQMPKRGYSCSPMTGASLFRVPLPPSSFLLSPPFGGGLSLPASMFHPSPIQSGGSIPSVP